MRMTAAEFRQMSTPKLTKYGNEPACVRYNWEKGARTPDEWRARREP